MELLVAFILLAFGLILALWGQRFNKILVPLLSFFIGFTAAAGTAALLTGGGFLANILDWVAGLALGAAVGLLTLRFRSLGTILVGGSLGYAVFVYLLLAMDIENSTMVAFGGLLGAVIFGLFSLIYRNKKWLQILLTASAGAMAIAAGLLLLFSQASIDDVGTGNSASFLQENPLLWPTLVLILLVLGFAAQSRSSSETP